MQPSRMAKSDWLRELRRRHVFGVEAAYAVVGWLLIQIATQVFPLFRIPGWSVHLLVLLVLAGFPVALVLAWAFGATQQGIVATPHDRCEVSLRFVSRAWRALATVVFFAKAGRRLYAAFPT